jgi:hypothetical protein
VTRYKGESMKHRILVTFALLSTVLSGLWAIGPPSWAGTKAPLARSAAAGPEKKLGDILGAMWTTVLETPSPQNPFGGGPPESACIDLGGTVAPFGPNGVATCTVKPGTKIFVAATSHECSTFEGNGTTEAELRSCAEAADAVVPTLTVDSKSVSVTGVETKLLEIVLPDDNIFELPAGTQGLSVGHGWVALLNPLTPGTHVIKIQAGSLDITTTIVVKPGH